MDYTSRMTALLGHFRRERNGVIADTMQYRGRRYGLNYGVSLPTVRAIARSERADHEWARYLMRQDVRELKLAALWIAEPDRVTADEFPIWAEGVVNSEMAEECAFALVSRSPLAAAWGRAWCETEDEWLQYAGLSALARLPDPQVESSVPIIGRLMTLRPDSRPIGQGVVALLVAAAADPRQAERVRRLVNSLPEGPAADYVREEIAWRLDF